MTDLIGTIDSDAEIEYDDDSEDEFEEKIHTKKDREQTTYVSIVIKVHKRLERFI